MFQISLGRVVLRHVPRDLLYTFVVLCAKPEPGSVRWPSLVVPPDDFVEQRLQHASLVGNRVLPHVCAFLLQRLLDDGRDVFPVHFGQRKQAWLFLYILFLLRSWISTGLHSCYMYLTYNLDPVGLSCSRLASTLFYVLCMHRLHCNLRF